MASPMTIRPLAPDDLERPRRPVPEGTFRARLARHGLRLALPTRMLYRGGVLFINGEAHAVGATAARLLGRLADRRSLAPQRGIDREAAELLYQWYRVGYVTLGDP